MSDRDELLRQRCTRRDWEVWQARARSDAVWSRTHAHRLRVDQSLEMCASFIAGPRGYIGVSWGKDSCALLLLTMAAGCDWPLVYVRIDPVANPDCALVRDAWFAMYPQLAERYTEIAIRCQPKLSTGRYDTNAAYESGFDLARRRFGERYLSGVRADEASIRRLTIRRNGLGDDESRTGRPLGYWQSEDVFAYLSHAPMHPAYPCTLSGAYERGRVRVNNLWGLYGEGHGRAEWESKYYGRELRAIEVQHAEDLVADRGLIDHAPRVVTWQVSR